MHSAATIVRLENVDVDIAGKRILHAVNLEVRADRHLGIVGSNGSGKSTLLALLAGRIWPAPGRGTRIYDFGNGPERDAITARERVALIGHELQDLYVARGWNFTACDIVHSGLTRTDIPQRRQDPGEKRKALALLETMNLEHLANRRLLQLSRGQQRRVLITRSLAFEPAMLLLDEPVSGLDTASRLALDAMLEQVAQRTCIVVAAHRRDELPALIDDIVTLDRGRLQSGGERIPDDGMRRDSTATDYTDTESTATDSTAPDNTATHNTALGRTASDTKDDKNARPIIELTNASVWLDRHQALKSLNWRLMPGENWLVTGPNGAGKSTFLRLLHAEHRPAVGGSIRWPDLGDPKDVWALRRRVALVSPELQARYRRASSVFDTIASGFHASIGLVQKLDGTQIEAVDALLRELALSEFRDRPLSSLSYGQRHRALIARCLIGNPRVLLLDEPWEGLDADTRELIAAALTNRMQAGAQVVCVSHIGAAGLQLNRQLAIEDGAIVSAGDSA